MHKKCTNEEKKVIQHGVFQCQCRCDSSVNHARIEIATKHFHNRDKNNEISPKIPKCCAKENYAATPKGGNEANEKRENVAKTVNWHM